MQCIHREEVATMPIIFCYCIFILVTMDIIFHWWQIESKGLKKHMYGYQQCYKNGKAGFMSMILHGMYLQIGSCCNAHNHFAVACSYLSQRPSFVTSYKQSKRDWRSICMGTCNKMSNGKTRLY
jgi:hypothetical protein